MLPGVKEWFDNRPVDSFIAFASNQGGVGLRYWMEQSNFGNPENYPTVQTATNHVEDAISKVISLDTVAIFISFAYQSKSSGKWSPIPDGAGREWQESWRKPLPGMIYEAMEWYGQKPENTVMVGDSPEDKQAAQEVGIKFVWAEEFFA